MPLCHFLIGVPGSGKSTLAVELANNDGYIIVSTDGIRSQLYGDPVTQGVWSEVETEAIAQISAALQSQKGVIYDATNCKRSFRMDFLQKVSMIEPLQNPTWVAWYLDTPLNICIDRNQQRDRVVPQEIIESMFKSLHNFPPLAAEGFAVVEKIDTTKFPPNTRTFQKYLQQRLQLQRRIINQKNRTQHANIVFHRYSKLLDFDRLMHLISLIVEYPGIGNLRATNPSVLESIFGCVPDFNSDIAEIAALLAKKRSQIYACEDAIAADLQWLGEHGVITYNEPLTVESSPDGLPITSTHPYSDTEPFKRLIGIIQFILHNPFLRDTSGGSLSTLAKALVQAGIIYGDGLATLRKDIEKILKPYKILPDFPLRNGYFSGTGILSKQELMRVFEMLQSQAKSLDDPVLLDFYEQFKQRMIQTKLLNFSENVYPVRSIAHHSIINNQYLHNDALANKQLQSQLEDAIARGQLLELNRFIDGGRYAGDEKSFFLVYPLQIVFHNLAWYLGYECVGGKEPGLLRFERLDRLFLGQPQNQARSRQEQEESLQRLQTLLKASAGLFLGYSVADQRQFLKQDKKKRSLVCVTVELWFNDAIYKFVVEGTKRFAQIKMTCPESKGRLNLPPSIFCFQEKTGDKRFPNRFQVILPKWSLDDFDLWRWIVGFGGNVKVIEPPELVNKVREIGTQITEVYDCT
ncbi:MULTISPECIES: WYL domain-containing protein [Nostocales]|uniref:Kinase n=3 Tax=Nostocales TaxID=1161 RepID=A0A0C1NEV6_9CYAN|nr:WYL domain-containing protein [Tolypothrix bouteillei]KAF3887648.1 WYL domain-containing protein [Tolypothrix bouteillei VB521301]